MKRQSRQNKPQVFSEEDVKVDILNTAKSINMPPGTAESIAEKTTKEVAKWVIGRKIITDDDLNMRIAKELQKYSRDLAYVYQNRGRII